MPTYEDDAIGNPAAFKPRDYKKSLSKPQSDDVMRRLTGYGSSALQSGLYALDTPGSFVRGGLGRLVGAKAKDGDRVSGRDLTDAIGLTNRYDKGLSGKALGIGAEILTDPLSYLTFGTGSALTGSGKALAKIGATRGLSRRAMIEGFHATESGLLAAGRSPSHIDWLRDAGKRIATPEMEQAVKAATGKDLLPNTPLGGMIGVGLPFKQPSAVFGTGARAKSIAGKLDSLGEKLKYGTTLGRWTNSLFDSNVGEAVGGATQKAMARYGTPALDAARAAGRENTYSVLFHLDEAIKAGVPEEEVLRNARQAAEGLVPGIGAAPHPSAVQAGQLAHQAENAQFAESRRAGMPLSDASDPFIQYAPRQGVDLKSAELALAGQKPNRGLMNPQVIDRNNLPVVTGSNFHRDEVYRGLPGGTEQVNDLTRQFAGSTLPADKIARASKKSLWLEAMAQGVKPTRDLGKQLDAKAAELAQRLPSLPEAHAKANIGLYSPNLTQDVARSAEQHARMMKTQAAVYGFLGEQARRKGALPSDSVPVSQALKDLGLTYTSKADPDAGVAMEGALVQAYRSLAKQGAGMVDPYLMGKRSALRKAVDQFGISRAHYNELLQSHGKWSMPEVLNEPSGVFRNLTNTFKNLAYPIWFPSHVRNAVSALGNNLSNGTSLKDHALAGRVMRETATADELRKIMPEIPIGVSDAGARDIARREMFAQGKVFDGHSGQTDLDNILASKLSGSTPGRISPEVFGTGRAGTGSFAGDTARLVKGGVADQLKAIGGHAANPLRNPFGTGGALGMNGVWGASKDFPALAVGRKVGTNIEDYFRAAHYLGSRRQGFNSATAGQSLRDLHFDYDKLTKFEKNVMRQAVPFYTYMRKNLPLQMKYLTSTPAKSLTQLRAMSVARQNGGYVPDYLSGGAAIPVGQSENGDQRFISGFGTPLEEALERIKFKGGLPDARGTALSYLGGLNPIIKAPLEQLFDTQFHTGRSLSDLRAQGLVKKAGSLWGDDNPQLLAQVLANTPATRFLSTFDKAVDSRKPLWARALNLGTGVKVTDVDLEKQRAIEAASARNEILRSMPHISQYTNFYPRKGEEGNLTPQEVEMLRMLRTMQINARDARKDEASRRPIGLIR